MTNFAASGANSATRVGWTLGAGVEYAVNNHWSLRAEYRYTDFGHLAISPDPSSVGAVFAVDRHLEQNKCRSASATSSARWSLSPLTPPRSSRARRSRPTTYPSPRARRPSPPFVMNWTGFYVGAQIGYGYGDNDGSITYATPGGLAGQSNLGSSAIIVGGSATMTTATPSA